MSKWLMQVELFILMQHIPRKTHVKSSCVECWFDVILIVSKIVFKNFWNVQHVILS